jgi:hypothetical protein
MLRLATTEDTVDTEAQPRLIRNLSPVSSVSSVMETVS